VEEGKNIFEYEYFDGGLQPKIILEWSEDGRNFVVVPPEMFSPVEYTTQASVSDDATSKDSVTQHNVLTDQEKKEGWKLLFDGKTTAGWHTFNTPGSVGRKWKVEEGVLAFEGRNRFRYVLEGRVIEMGDTKKKEDGGLDIVTNETFQNFEFKIDWKISEGGNSGIFYTVKEDPQYDEAWKTSPEMQVLDNEKNKDGLIYKHRAGDLYDLIACSEVTVKAQGQWNSVKVVKSEGKVEHWLNGVKVVEYDMKSKDWKDMISKSKFAALQEFGTAKDCKIGLQDHDNKVWYRNIKIRKLK
jgi:cytochrome c